MKRPPNPGHLTIPVPNEIGVSRSPDELFALEYGDERAEEERRRYEAERACTCGAERPHLWGKRGGHKSPCPRAGRKF